jgi:hypothetical protein
MQGVAMRFARSAARRSWIGEMRRVLLALLTVLDRLVRPRDGAPPERELPAEWFKYPPA